MNQRHFFMLLTAWLFFFYATSLSAQQWYKNKCQVEANPLEEGMFYDGPEFNTDSVITIPVVFHVLTQGGAENLSKATILQALHQLNLDFSRQNSDTVSIPGPFQQVRANPQMEFRLARLDPQGNCTDGINRIYTPYTGAFDNPSHMQPDFSWDHKRYLNIYLVKWIDGGLDPLLYGLSYLTPIDNNNILPQYDRLMVVYYGLPGSIRSDFPGNFGGHLLGHETGHNLGLKHTFGWDAGCFNDDDVSDTPLQGAENYDCPSFPHISCNNGPNGDMFNNFMDYTDCMNMFTAGQVGRMRTCLNNNAWRASLWTQSNLEQTGVFSSTAPCANPPVADFGFGNFANWLCAGEPVRFYEATTWTPTQLQWTFEGGVPAYSDQPEASVVFEESGPHTVTLIASNAYGADTITRIIQVRQRLSYTLPMTESFENDAHNQALAPFVVEGQAWAVTDLTSVSGSKSMRLDTGYQYFSGFFTHTFDLDQLQQENRVLEFKVALGLSTLAPPVAGGLRVEWIRPCEYNWVSMLGGPTPGGPDAGAFHDEAALLATDLQTATVSSNQLFLPNANQWKTITLPVPDTLQGEIQIGFVWGQFNATNALKGLYLDDIKITGTVSTASPEVLSGWRIYPNPATGIMVSEATQWNGSGQVEITDVSGRALHTFQQTDPVQQFAIGHLVPGVYVVRFRSTEGMAFQKLIKQ